MGLLDQIVGSFDRDDFRSLNSEMSFEEYLVLVKERPKLTRTAYQMIYDMIMERGSYRFERYRKQFTNYNFFDDAAEPIYGLAETKDAIVKFVRGAAGHYGTEKRVLLLCGPVGSSKSTICRLLKRGLERYSRSDEGALYTYKWVDLPTGVDGVYDAAEDLSSMHANPLLLLPQEVRHEFLVELNEIHQKGMSEEERKFAYELRCDGDLAPRCKFFMNFLLKRYDGDLAKVLRDHIRVVRLVISESDRVGIATFQPKDEKNQDATELTGDVNFAKLSKFGGDSDPRAFNFDGEFCRANRGIFEAIEMLKLSPEFLYDFLGASQERNIKPKKLPQIWIDEMIIGHSNLVEMDRLKANQSMEALRDRTVKIDVPYNLRWSDEIKILEKDYGPGKVDQHIAPHTLEIAALWAILTRLEDDKEGGITLVEKAELYDGRMLPGWTEDAVKELIDKTDNEGMATGVSPRYVQDKISNCLSDSHPYVSAFTVLNELKEGLFNSTLFSDKDLIARYSACVTMAIGKLREVLTAEVQEALIGDRDAVVRLCTQYIDNVMAYNAGTKVKNAFTGRDEKPDERLMRSVEEKIGIPNNGVDEFRNQIAQFIGDLAHKGERFHWDSNPRLKKALEAKLFEDVKDTIKLSALSIAGSSVVDPDIQKKIDAIKYRMIEQYGYTEQSASDVLSFVASIWARGNMVDEDE